MLSQGLAVRHPSPVFLFLLWPYWDDIISQVRWIRPQAPHKLHLLRTITHPTPNVNLSRGPVFTSSSTLPFWMSECGLSEFELSNRIYAYLDKELHLGSSHINFSLLLPMTFSIAVPRSAASTVSCAQFKIKQANIAKEHIFYGLNRIGQPVRHRCCKRWQFPMVNICLACIDLVRLD